jgi:hypothetical protein
MGWVVELFAQLAIRPGKTAEYLPHSAVLPFLGRRPTPRPVRHARRTFALALISPCADFAKESEYPHFRVENFDNS